MQGTDEACNKKGSILATISGGTAGYSYTWSGPISGSTSSSQSSNTIDNLVSGFYTVTVRDVNGCEATQTITINNQGGAITISTSQVSSIACENDGSVNLIFGGGSAPYHISYTGVASGSATSNADDFTLIDLIPGDYTIIVTDANGCSGTRKIRVEDNGSDLAVALTPTNISCGGKGMITVALSGGLPNYQVTWSGGGINGSINTGESSVVLTDLPAGDYTIQVSDGLGCSVSESASVNNVGGNIDLQLVPNNDVCGQGGSIEVRISGGSPNYYIAWSGPSSGNAITPASTFIIDGLTPGNYSVDVRDANGCEVKEWIGINTGGDVKFNLVTTDAECNQAGDILVNITAGSPNYIVRWTGPTSGAQVVTSNVYRIEGLSGGDYSVTVEDNKGCEATQSASINASSTNVVLTLTNTNASCGASNGNITATVSGGQGDYLYSWTGPVNGSQTSSESTFSIWDLPAGLYNITVQDNNGCIVTKSIQVGTIGNNLGLNVIGKDASCGQPASIQVTISNGTPNFRIEWSGPSFGAVNTSNNSYTINGVNDGEYTIRVTDATGCTTAQAVIIQSSQNDLSFTFETKDAACETKGAIFLTIQDGNGPYQIEWDGPSSGTTTSTDIGVQITDLAAGIYAVTVRDKNGCVITQQIEVRTAGGSASTVNFAFKPGTVTCNKNGEILLTMITGTAPFTVLWTGPSSGSRTASSTDITIPDLQEGIYLVTVSGSGGCGSLSQYIEVEDKRVVLGVNGTVSNGVCGGKGNVQLDWSGDRGPYTVSWSGPLVGSFALNGNSYTINDLPSGDYIFKVRGFDGCEGQYQATVNNDGTVVTANFTFNISAKTLNFTNLSSAGTYLWDFGDGNTSTEINPTHTYERNGSYQVCLKVTNDCGTKQFCQSVSINAVSNDESTSRIVLGEKSGPKGSVLQLPVRVENCTKIATLSGTITMGNSDVAQINGISPSAISPIYNDQNYSFSYLSAGTGMSIDSETILFYINVQLIGDIGESSTIDLSSLPVSLELTCTDDGFSPPVTPEVGSGRVSIATSQFNIADVGGTVKTFLGEGIAETMVTIRSEDSEMNPMTEASGEYFASDVPTGYEYTFVPEKNTNPENGLSTFGLFLTQKYILGYDPEQIVSPYQIIAMDANCSGTITTFDLFAMQQMIIGNITEFPGCDSWVFVDANHEFQEDFSPLNIFPYPNSHTMMLDSDDAVADFIGVKIGDILGRAIPNDGFINSEAESRNSQVIPVQIARQEVQAGEIFEVPFSITESPEMVSFQLGLDFDMNSMELLELIPNAKSLPAVKSGVQDNQVKISWFNSNGEGVTLVNGEALFTLKFVAKKNISDLLAQISINNRTFASELHTQTEQPYRFKLESKSPINSAFAVYQNVPNPFKDFTTIVIKTPESINATIKVYDQFGRMVRNLSSNLTVGENKIQIERRDLIPGIYYYTVNAGTFTNTKRMLIVE